MHIASFINGIKPLFDHYDTFILDQWGVLHVGEPAPDHVLDTLRALKAAGKRIVILSNSGRAASFSAARMAEWRITPDMYDMLMTSGEMVRCGLRDKTAPVFDKLGKNCFVISRKGDTSVLDNIDVSVVVAPEKADFVLLINYDYEQKTIKDYLPLLKEIKARNLPMICANPDKKVIDAGGTNDGPGMLASAYEDLGGKVSYIGKPYTPVFAFVLAQMPDALPSRTIMVGDSMGHDIVGGAGMGFDTCLISGGVHADVFAAMDKKAAIEKLNAQYNVCTTYVCEKFAL